MVVVAEAAVVGLLATPVVLLLRPGGDRPGGGSMTKSASSAGMSGGCCLFCMRACVLASAGECQRDCVGVSNVSAVTPLPRNGGCGLSSTAKAAGVAERYYCSSNKQ